MTDRRKIFFLDSYALIFRAYYAFISNPMRNASGMNTSTIFGFTLVLDEILRKENPSHIVAVFDAPGPSFRNEMFEDYKANRDETPEEIKNSVPWIIKLLEAYQIPILQKEGFEADDIIGTLVREAEEKNFEEIYMMTPDKDFAQLVTEKIQMYKPGRSGKQAEILGVSEVREKFHVEHPDQVIDILALWGDSSDNVPGVPGIGEKTAKKLIGQYGSVEGVYENINQLKGKQKENLEKAKDQVKLSKQLVTIDVNVPVELDVDKCKRHELKENEIEKLFAELDFKNLSERILGKAPVKSGGDQSQGMLFDDSKQNIINEASALRNIDNTDHSYELIDSKEELTKLVKKIKKKDSFCFDTETTSLNPIDAKLVGIAFSSGKHQAWYVHYPDDQAMIDVFNSIIEPLFGDGSIVKTGQNLKYDLHVLKNYGIEVKGVLFDTMLAHYLLFPDQKHSLNAMAEALLNYSMVSIETLIGEKGKKQRSFSDVPIKKAKEYAGEDADITWQLSEILRKDLKKKGLDKLAYEIEMPLVRVLMDMEHHGVQLDTDSLEQFTAKLRNDLKEVEERIHKMAGVTFNISSAKQLGNILFERLKIVEKPRMTKTRQYATSEEVLQDLVDKHEIVSEVLNFRSLKKLLTTYVDALPKLIHPETGKIHTTFNQALVATGRLSSNNPNLQNIPIREERGREIRKAFTTSGKDYLFVSADYSQIELRLMAHLSQDSKMIEAFVNNEDIHTSTASKIYKVKPEEVTREMRSKAKTANFGIIYGISAYGLSQRMRIPRKEASELIEGYFESYPAVKKYMDHCIEKARDKGYVETMYGRVRALPDITSRNSVVRGNAERNAINTPLQGSAADIIKIAMVRIYEAFKKEGLKSKMILQVHDELNFDVFKKELEQAQRIIKDEMENAVSLRVPLVVDVGAGKNWFEAH